MKRPAVRQGYERSTSDANSERAYTQPEDRFPTWEQVAGAPEDQVAGAIRCGGIADQKARRIQQILGDGWLAGYSPVARRAATRAGVGRQRSTLRKQSRGGAGGK